MSGRPPARPLAPAGKIRAIRSPPSRKICLRTDTNNSRRAGEIPAFISVSRSQRETARRRLRRDPPAAISPVDAEISQSRRELDDALIISSVPGNKSLSATFPCSYLARDSMRDLSVATPGGKRARVVNVNLERGTFVFSPRDCAI